MNLRDLRKAKNLTQSELAMRVGVTQTYIGALEKGRRTNPSMGVITGIARELGVKASKVLEVLSKAV